PGAGVDCFVSNLDQKIAELFLAGPSPKANVGSEEFVDEEISLPLPVAVLIEDQNCLEPEHVRARCHLPSRVRLSFQSRDDSIGADGECFSQAEFEVTDLVTAEGNPGEVVALNPELTDAQV